MKDLHEKINVIAVFAAQSLPRMFKENVLVVRRS